jgi:aquaporin Z
MSPAPEVNRADRSDGAARALRTHWPEYACEAAGLALFMVSACFFCALLEHPSSPLRSALPDARVRRAAMGLAMGATAVGLIYSPWGKRSGAHINPAVTLTFFRLGRVAGWDAFFYVVAQYAGAAAGIVLALAIAPGAVMHPSVNYVVTAPGAGGWAVAMCAELAISFGLMFVVLTLTASPRWAPHTGLAAGALVASYIAVEAPFSGMSMNPARSAGSALVAHVWTAWWVYLVAPPAAMLLAAETYVRTAGRARDGCAKLHHARNVRCIFCGFRPPVAASPAAVDDDTRAYGLQAPGGPRGSRP